MHKTVQIACRTLLLGCVCTLFACNRVKCSDVTYSNDVKPLIEANCTASGCHGSSSLNGDYTSYSGLSASAVSGKLNERVIEKKDMPKEKSLSKHDRKVIKCWIDNGAPNN